MQLTLRGITYYGDEFIKLDKSIKVIGGEIAVIDNVDFGEVVLKDGEWTIPETQPTLEQRTTAMEQALLTMMRGNDNV